MVGGYSRWCAAVVGNPESSKTLASAGLKALPQRAALDGISARVPVYEIP